MNLLMICPQFRPLVGGYERAAERLSVALVRRGHRVTVVAERRDAAWPRIEQFDGFTVRRLWCAHRRGLHSLTALTSYALWLLRHGRRFDVWHVHQYGLFATLAVLLGIALRRPVALKLTSSADQSIGNTIADGHLHRLQAWAHRRVAACFAVSEESFHDAITFGIPPAHVHLIPNGVDTRRFVSAVRAESLCIKDRLGCVGSLLAVAVGRLALEKNPLGLLDAWAKAREQLPADAQLAWVGDGPLRDAAQVRTAELRLGDSVIWVGHTDAVIEWMAAADLYLLPSRNEGMANTLLEAMSSGLPSVATRVSGVPQLLEKTGAGLVVDVGDMDAFADEIVRLANNPLLREQLGLRAREVIESDYSIERVAGRIEEIYQRIGSYK